MSTKERSEFVRDLRHDLGIQLGRIRFAEPDVTWYDSLSRGTLRSFAEAVPEYSLSHMTRELTCGGAVDNVYNEYMSEVLSKDIYLVDAVLGDVYITGDDDDILYKHRPSIVIAVWPGHYELIGVREDNTTQTLFHPDHPLIDLITHRRHQLLHPAVSQDVVGSICTPECE
jgi:hypothetical protein